jgi:hypothetical protein
LAARRAADVLEGFMFLFDVISTLETIFLHFMTKHLRHQDTKTQRKILTKGFALCLGAFVAICSGLSELWFY